MIRLKINGTNHEFGGDAGMPLLWYLRGSLQLTGTKFGCGSGLCGAVRSSERSGDPFVTHGQIVPPYRKIAKLDPADLSEPWFLSGDRLPPRGIQLGAKFSF